MAAIPDNFDKFWEEHCRRFLEENPAEEVYPPPCDNPYFPWTLSDRKIYRTNADWVHARKAVFGGSLPNWFVNPAGLLIPSPRGNGLALWDRCVLVPRQHDNVIAAGQATGTYTNTDWVGILNCLNNVTTKKRPKGDFVFDILSQPNAWDLMETAHILTHKMQDVGDYSSTSTILAACVLKLCLALKYDLVVDIDPNKPHENTRDGLEKIGCRIHMTNRLRNPSLDVPCTGPKSLVLDRDNVVLAGSVQFEPQPNPDNVSSGKWMEVNRWSCLPTIVCFAGWQTSDFVSHAQLVRYKTSTQLYWEVPVQSLEPSSMFAGLLVDTEPDNIRYFRLLDYWQSNKYKVDKDLYPALPCRSCMKVNTQIEGCPQKPRGPKDDTPAWSAYAAGMEAIFQTCQKATIYQEGRKIGHLNAKKRQKSSTANYRDLRKLKEKSSKLQEKARQKKIDGYLSDSKMLLLQVDILKGQIERMENGEGDRR